MHFPKQPNTHNDLLPTPNSTGDPSTQHNALAIIAARSPAAPICHILGDTSEYAAAAVPRSVRQPHDPSSPCATTFWTSAAAGEASACRKRFTPISWLWGTGGQFFVHQQGHIINQPPLLSVSRSRTSSRGQGLNSQRPDSYNARTESLLTMFSWPRLQGAPSMCGCIIVPR